MAQAGTLEPIVERGASVQRSLDLDQSIVIGNATIDSIRALICYSLGQRSSLAILEVSP